MNIDKTKCIGCNSCLSICPANAIANIDGKCQIDQNKCMHCHTCLSVCPMNAISE